MVRTPRHKARLLATLGAFLAAGAGFVFPAQASEPVKPVIQAPLRAQTRVVTPRVVSSATLPQAEMVAPELVHAMTNLVLQPFTFEAEDWGDRPDLGFTVQDMTGFGNEWSGNKQIFWNPQPPHNAFKWDFSAPGGAMLRIYLTAAPDYANLNIRLGCYRQVSENYYQLMSQRLMTYNGYASTVTRRQVVYPLVFDPQCKNADMFRLLFTAQPAGNKTFGGIDSIVVSK